uniref:PH domain-containing protein n=1 Tax=Entomoneis paludosa TaxID=265537 RepID=A0A7S2YHV0_9STRA|mmetsp:Transcript_33555/g.69816  ORF Transcript_33555/g.69816 Transcript_33555/m.69816 type:complete len:752 (+) Transcript_33555:276-2531(+)|eukprot:CAMPEP_0172465642 /NCGR_PEP_ID=MMETSP1065-20121228/54114_1 /TAXON_ID=265537 /ORGANISM="Amphiprora paludosa, Strain CCMP125" /LENGTH=751 /DNA_ID=CAMNT_0013222231 /DNA_START=262 /DNA_END=2517 /DNA_ORIENTATION=+
MGESHRVYWQQWLSNNEKSTGSRREWITSSVAVRMAPEARAIDVTNLLRQSLGLSNNSQQQPPLQDALILVGTLYSLSSDFLQYEHHGSYVTSTARVISRGGGMHRPAADRSAPTAATAGASSVSSSSTVATSTTPATRSDPIHLVYTLEPNDAPLVVRDRMVGRIRTLEEKAVTLNGGKGRHIISSTAPQIQWYFIPAIPPTTPSPPPQGGGTTIPTMPSPKNSNIPNCLQLEGYCTSMEEEEFDEDEDEDDDDNDFESPTKDEPRMTSAARRSMSVDYDEDEGKENGGFNSSKDNPDGRSIPTLQEKMEAKFPWLKDHQSGRESPPPIEHSTTSFDNPLSIAVTVSKRQPRSFLRKLARERKRGNELIASCRARQPPSHLSGFLLKRCNRDRHVWRKVHCVLTDDYLWFMTRVYSNLDASPNSNNNNSNNPHEQIRQEVRPSTYRYSKHGRLRLTRALLLEPAIDYAPLYRTPYAFELVTPDGTSHAFRATSKHAQLQWIRVLSERIVQSYENSLLEQAELILVDDCLAKSKRMEQVLNVDRLVEASSSSSGAKDNNSISIFRRNSSTGTLDQVKIRRHCLLQWGLMVADYREFGRHVHSTMPAKNPVVVSSLSQQPRPSPTSAAKETIAALSLTPQPPTFPPAVRQLIRTSWAQAHQLLAVLSAGPSVADQVMTSTSSDGPFAYPRRIETLLHHVEFQITGRHHTSGSSQSSLADLEGTVSTHQSFPPPLDLFDPLLQELQTMAAPSD